MMPLPLIVLVTQAPLVEPVVTKSDAPFPHVLTTNADQSGPRWKTRPAGSAANAWRYVLHQGRWWYWSANERWSYLDGARWRALDLLNQPLTRRAAVAGVAAAAPEETSRFQGLRFFGGLPAPRSRAGSFGVEGGARMIGRNFAGSFEARTTPHTVLSPPGQPATAAPYAYGPGSEYGAYGSTNPFRRGLYTGAGGNYGYGLGARRPATVGGYGKTYP